MPIFLLAGEVKINIRDFVEFYDRVTSYNRSKIISSNSNYTESKFFTFYSIIIVTMMNTKIEVTGYLRCHLYIQIIYCHGEKNNVRNRLVKRIRYAHVNFKLIVDKDKPYAIIRLIEEINTCD